MFQVHLTAHYPEVRRHFTPDKLFEDCAFGLGVYTTRACTMVDKAITLGREGRTMNVLQCLLRGISASEN